MDDAYICEKKPLLLVSTPQKSFITEW